MQNLNPGSSDAVTASEAREILAAWNNRMAAQGVDPSVGSVQALASGLGVSEESVRQMLEDIRVQKRSQAIAAGIIEQQQQQRKKSDINAAIIAAVAIVVVIVGIAGFVFFSRGGAGLDAAAAPVVVEPVHTITIPQIPIPPIPPIAVFEDNNVSIVNSDGSSINIDPTGFHKVSKDGSVISLRGERALEAVRSEVQNVAQKMAELKLKSPQSAEDIAETDRLRTTLDALKQGLKIIATTPGTPAPAPAADF